MPLISNISFNVKYNLQGVPTLILTDTSTIPAGSAGIFYVTMPDGYTRYGNFTSPDITSSGGSFSIPLRLDSQGNVQTGQYKIVYEIKTSDEVVSSSTRTYQFDYVPVALNMVESFDVFTPSLFYQDATVYQRSSFNAGPVTRTWNVNSVPTGVITGSGGSIDLKKDGKYYDANYTVQLTIAVIYTHQVYTWLTVDEVVTKYVNTYAETPPTLAEIVNQVTSLRTKVDSLSNTIQPYEDGSEDFQTAQTLFTHIVDKLRVNNTINIYNDLKNLIRILRNNQIPTYTPTNQQILPYNIDSLFSNKWGNMTGNIQDQTDLWSYLNTLTQQNTFVFDKQTAAAVWNVYHNMGKFPSVTIVDTAGDEVDAKVTHNNNNQLTITFSAAVSGKAYLN